MAGKLDEQLDWQKVQMTAQMWALELVACEGNELEEILVAWKEERLE